MSNKRKLRGAPRKPKVITRASDYVGPGHPQVEVKHPTDGTIEVDAGIADLIVALWAARIDTIESCQEVPELSGNVLMIFPAVSAQRFIDTLFPYDPDKPHGPPTGMERRATAPGDQRGVGGWTWDGFPLDMTSPPQVGMMVSFPQSDLAEVTRRIKAADVGEGDHFSVVIGSNEIIVFPNLTALVRRPGDEGFARAGITDQDLWILQAVRAGDPFSSVGRDLTLKPLAADDPRRTLAPAPS